MDWTAVVLSLLSLASIQPCQATSPDIIKSMPGLLKQPSFNMYSGYLDGTGTNKLHYWFIESQHAVTDPLIIWLSGRPGCSALYSLLSSNGPFRVRSDGVNIDYNANSWNLNANLLYIDAPAGTGFSYSTSGSTAWNDTGVTEEFFQSLLSFFTKYPQSTLYNIYLAGDGYAGVFAPLLLQKLDSVSKKLPLELQGLALGNPLTSLMLQDNSIVYYAYSHGIIGEKLWSTLNLSCCTSQGSCNFHNNTNKACIAAISETYHDLMNIGINPYKVNGNCASGVPGRTPGRGTSQKDGFYHYVAGMKHMFANYDFQQKEQKRIKGIPAWKLKADLPCVDVMAVTKYLNSAAVKSALHVTNSTAGWQMCNAKVEQYYTRQYSDMSSIYTDLLNTYKYRILVYSGDQDATYNLLGSERFVAGLHRQAEVQWRPWLYESALKQNQVGGFVQEYDNIAFLTVKNAGFWAARDQPSATSLLIYNFINKRPYMYK